MELKWNQHYDSNKQWYFRLILEISLATKCPANQVYQECASACKGSCSALSGASEKCREECIPGCNCPANLVMNDFGTCVPATECKCFYNGQTYGKNAILYKDKCEKW